jgi:hypothetical protein
MDLTLATRYIGMKLQYQNEKICPFSNRKQRFTDFRLQFMSIPQMSVLLLTISDV